MKAKKALKRLNKVESMLSGVIEGYPASARGLRELLDSAKASVGRAREMVNARVARATRKPPARSQESRQGLSAEGRKRISLAAKKRWAVAKRKGVHAVTGRRLNRTA
jgi:hypothetical protein